ASGSGNPREWVREGSVGPALAGASVARGDLDATRVRTKPRSQPVGSAVLGEEDVFLRAGQGAKAAGEAFDHRLDPAPLAERNASVERDEHAASSRSVSRLHARGALRTINPSWSHPTLSCQDGALAQRCPLVDDRAVPPAR